MIIRFIMVALVIALLAACNSSADKEKTTDSATTTTSTQTEYPNSTPVEATKIETAQVPKELKFRGKIKEAWQWNDKLGTNILLLTELPPYAVKVPETDDEEGMTVELFAYHYAKKDTAYRIVWRLNDIIKACGLDYAAEFLKDATSITDLDKDGTAETIVQYKLVCRGDVSPSYKKLIMHEDSVKYALKGNMWTAFAVSNDPNTPMPVTEDDVNLEKMAGYKPDEDFIKSYGRYETEKDFASAPPEFLSFARSQWLKFIKESFE